MALYHTLLVTSLIHLNLNLFTIKKANMTWFESYQYSNALAANLYMYELAPIT